jgi:hypothetical protein
MSIVTVADGSTYITRIGALDNPLTLAMAGPCHPTRGRDRCSSSLNTATA